MASTSDHLKNFQRRGNATLFLGVPTSPRKSIQRNEYGFEPLEAYFNFEKRKNSSSSNSESETDWEEELKVELERRKKIRAHRSRIAALKSRKKAVKPKRGKTRAPQPPYQSSPSHPIPLAFSAYPAIPPSPTITTATLEDIVNISHPPTHSLLSRPLSSPSRVQRFTDPFSSPAYREKLNQEVRATASSIFHAVPNASPYHPIDVPFPPPISVSSVAKVNEETRHSGGTLFQRTPSRFTAATNSPLTSVSMVREEDGISQSFPSVVSSKLDEPDDQPDITIVRQPPILDFIRSVGLPLKYRDKLRAYNDALSGPKFEELSDSDSEGEGGTLTSKSSQKEAVNVTFVLPDNAEISGQSDAQEAVSDSEEEELSEVNSVEILQSSESEEEAEGDMVNGTETTGDSAKWESALEVPASSKEMVDSRSERDIYDFAASVEVGGDLHPGRTRASKARRVPVSASESSLSEPPMSRTVPTSSRSMSTVVSPKGRSTSVSTKTRARKLKSFKANGKASERCEAALPKTPEVTLSEEVQQVPMTVSPGGRKYRCVDVKKNTAYTPGVRRSHRTRVPAVSGWKDFVVDYGQWASEGQEVKRLLYPMKEERRRKKRKVRERMGGNNEEYPEVEYKDANGDIVATERAIYTFESASVLPTNDKSSYSVSSYWKNHQSSMGVVTIAPGGCKKKSKPRGPLFLLRISGRVMVTMNELVYYIIAGQTTMKIPDGVGYSIKNMSKTQEAKLYYVSLEH